MASDGWGVGLGGGAGAGNRLSCLYAQLLIFRTNAEVGTTRKHGGRSWDMEFVRILTRRCFPRHRILLAGLFAVTVTRYFAEPRKNNMSEGATFFDLRRTMNELFRSVTRSPLRQQGFP